VVVIAALNPRSDIESHAEVTNDPLDMVKPFAKWIRSVPDKSRLGEFVDEAVRHASNGRPGVAVLGVPSDFEGTAVHRFDTEKKPLTRCFAPMPDPEAIEAAADLVCRAKRLIVLAGTGAALSGAGPGLRKLAQTFNIPVMTNALGRGLVSEDLILGYSWPLAQIAVKEADVVLCLGIRLTQRMGYGLAPQFHPEAEFIQVDILPEEIGRNRHIQVPIVGDACRAIEMLYSTLRRRGAEPKISTEWVNRSLRTRMARIEEIGYHDGPPIHPYRIARDLMHCLPENAVYVGDGADIQNWMHAVLRIRSERAYMDHYPFGSMGIGTPLALGAAAGARELAQQSGQPERPVVLVTGDGAFGFYSSEFNSAALAGLKFICIISNDGAWGTEKHGQIKALGTSHNCELGHCDYHLVAHAYGGIGERIEDPADFAPALARALDARRPAVLNVITDPMAGAVRKNDPLVQTVVFNHLASSLRKQYDPVKASKGGSKRKGKK
jgi:acetolactate synthase-1/2/3 large subunit